ncbi:C2 family cysteine protease [Micromonospora zingiberis]|uniref:C2 family cysteine protease n=1 Tax=Micromonospora zingiberis TaxID=2053011 RepID=UPI003B835121
MADGELGPDLGTVVDEGTGGHGDQLDQAVTHLPVDEQVGDRTREPRDHPPVPQGGRPVGAGSRQVDADQFGVVGIGGLDGVGVPPAQVEVVGVGQDSGVQLGGRGHDGSVSTAGSVTASAVPGSTFHGLGRPAADPAAVLDVARVALPQVAPYAQVDAVVPVGSDRFEIRSAGQPPLTVRLTTGPLTDGVVAQSTGNPDGTFTVTVSDRAVDQVVARALAHEVAELVALHEAGPALVGPLDPGNVRGPLSVTGLTAHDRGRLAEIRLLAAAYAGADAAGRLAVRAEIDALADHLGLRVGDPDVRARWALLPGDVLTQLMQLSVPSLTPEAVSAVLAGAPTRTEVERVRMIDYRSRLAPDFQVPQPAALTARLRELAVEAEHAQSGMPRMPAFAGQIVGIPQAQLDRVRAVDPQLADRLAREGVYVDLTGRYDLRPYMVADLPAIDLGAARPAFDLSTEAGRQAQLHEDRQRSRAALRGLHADQAAALLASHDFHYQGSARWMGLVPDALTDVLRGITPVAPAPVGTVESAANQGPAGDTRVVADRVTLPPESPTEPGPAYGPALDARTGQPPPLFDGPPTREDVQQGALGDCGMIAVIGAVAGQLPDTITRMFQPNPDGSVDVLLHEASGPGQSVTATGRQLRVTVWPDVPLHANSNGRSAYADQSVVGTAWASLLEKAIAAVDRTWTQHRHDLWQQQWSARPGADPNQAAPLGYARLGNGSSRLVQAELLTQLTGLPSNVSQFDPTPGREADAEARLAALLAAGSPVITGSLPAARYPGQPPYGLVPGHAYEIVSVANGEVRLRNPWNSSHPAPMPVRALLDLMSPWYGHVEVAQSSVAALPDSEFHGQGRPAADPTAVVDRARLVLPTLAETIGADQIVTVGPDVFEVRATGLAPLRVQVAAGALTGETVAQTIRNLDGTFTLTVSDRAGDAVVDRAVAHEFAELLARHETGQAQVGLFDQGAAERPIDPAGLTARDRGRLAELRLMAAWYAQSEPTTRLVLRREIDALVDRLGLRWGTPEATARLALLPPDGWHQVIRLSVPGITPDTVTGALAYKPDPTIVERFRAIDYRSRLAPDFQPPPAAELTAKLRELAVHGEQSQSSLPRMPALAGQVIALPPAALASIRQTDPRLADRLATEGVYIDLTGRFDLRPYALDGAPEFPLTVSAPAFDLTTEAGRKALLAEDRSRVAAAFRAAYGSNPAAMAVLSTHGFHYLTDARRMALVPNALTDVLRAMLPPDPSTEIEIEVEVEVEPTVTDSEIAVVADRVTLPDPNPNYPVEYGQALDDRTGQAAPLFDGSPHREHVRQGVLEDCGMLATMAAVAGYRPDALAQLFQPNPDGTVDVLLHESVLYGGTSAPTGRRLRITVQPDVPLHVGSSGEAAYADRSSNGSGWASVLEKALAAVDRTWTNERRDAWQRDWTTWCSKDDPHQAAPLGYARLDVGSTSYLQAELMTQLTGVPSQMSFFDTRPGQEAVVATRLAALLAAGSPVIAGTRPENTYPPGLATLPFGLYAKHAYEVVSVTNGLVRLRNPWGHEHPAPIPVRDFLDLMASDYAHMDVGGASSAPQTGTVTSTFVPPAQPSIPAPRAVETTIKPEGDRPRRHTLGRTYLEDERAIVNYLALLDDDGTVNGLSVVVSSGVGQRTAHWATNGTAGVGGSIPVGRAEAERIAREVLGFTLPEEPALHDMVGG